VVAARKRVAAAAKQHGKFMMAPGFIAPREELEAEGFRIFNLGADVLGLGDYLKAKVADFENGRRRQGPKATQTQKSGDRKAPRGAR
jgi:4-hydroxy-2-oxoheptanedioate aldolase